MTAECHNLEQYADGSTGFFTAREHAWHRLGEAMTGVLTADQALERAKLKGWNVRKTPLTTTVISDTGVSTIEVPDQFASIRNNPVTGQIDVLGVVGNVWEPKQNEETAATLDLITSESGAHFETGGSLKEGRQVFLSMKMPEGILIGGQDAVDYYLIALNNHDGNGSLHFLVSMIRPVCQNTVEMAKAMAKASFKIRHTANAALRIEEVRAALKMSFRYVESFQAEAERMIQTAMTDSAFEKIVAELVAVDEEKDSPIVLSRKAEKADTLRWLFTEADTQANIRGTNWAAFQAVGEYVDHFSPVNGTKNPADVRALRTLTAAGASDTKSLAFNLLRVPA